MGPPGGPISGIGPPGIGPPIGMGPWGGPPGLPPERQKENLS